MNIPVMDKEYNIKSYDVTLKNELKPYALFHYLEDIAYHQAEELNFGYSTIAPKGIFWFVVKYNMIFEKLPSSFETLTIRTRPSGVKGVQCYRDFELYIKDEKIGTITSSWILVDKNKRPQNPHKVVQFPFVEDKRLMSADFNGFKEFEIFDIKKQIEIRYDDIDINMHVNNANYISWALDSLSYDFKTKHVLKQVEIAYKKEISYGNTVLSLVRFDCNKTYHRLLNNETNEVLCDIRIGWK